MIWKRWQIMNSSGGFAQPERYCIVNKGYGAFPLHTCHQDKQRTLRYGFLRSIEQSKTLPEGYRADIDHADCNYNLPAGVAIEVIHEEDQFADFSSLSLPLL